MCDFQISSANNYDPMHLTPIGVRRFMCGWKSRQGAIFFTISIPKVAMAQGKSCASTRSEIIPIYNTTPVVRSHIQEPNGIEKPQCLNITSQRWQCILQLSEKDGTNKNRHNTTHRPCLHSIRILMECPSLAPYHIDDDTTKAT
jgi:hypothetical protein